MSVWICIPSIRPHDVLKRWVERWHAQGYKVALWRDDKLLPHDPTQGYLVEAGTNGFPPILVGGADMIICGNPYPGYAVACNRLIRKVLEKDPECHWVVCGGDDVWPDPNKRADEIAAECSRHFIERAFGRLEAACSGPVPEHLRFNTAKLPAPPTLFAIPGSTFGCMQATGDRWQDTPATRTQFGQHRGALIDRVAGSPWIGREFALRINQGNGPYYPQFEHMYVDEALMCVAEKYGVFWQRRDLTHYHDHAMRVGEHGANAALMPEHLRKWNSAEHWNEAKGHFEKLRNAGWPGSEPLTCGI